MADYTERPRPRTQQRYWYLANGDVLREPTLYSTPAERRFSIGGPDEDAFWASDLIGELDKWAENEARDRGTGVLAAAINRTGDEGEDWLKEAYLQDIDRKTGIFEPPSGFAYATNAQAKFTFTNETSVVVFKISLDVKRSYYSNDRYTVSKSVQMSEPQGHRPVGVDDGPDRFMENASLRALEDFEITDLLGEKWGGEDWDKVLSTHYDDHEYALAAGEFCRLSMQIADFEQIGDGYTIYESKWDPQYPRTLQEALMNEGPIKKLNEHLNGVKEALSEMGFNVSEIEESQLWNLAANGGSATVTMRIHDKKERPWTTMIIDFPTGRLFASEKQTIDQDSLTLYELAMKRAERDGSEQELKAALALLSSGEAFKNQDIAQRAVDAARRIIPTHA